MWPSWLPDDLKRQLFDRVIDFIDLQSEHVLDEQVRTKIRSLSTQGAMQLALDDALQRARRRFEQEYLDIDEDVVLALMEEDDFWHNGDVRKSLLIIVSHPGIARTEAHSQIVEHFETVLPQRRNRERIDKAVTYLLRLVAEEVWTIPGAREIRELYTLQVQRLSAEATQDQVRLLQAQLQATTQLNADIREALLLLTVVAEQRLLAAPTSPHTLPLSRPWHNLPPRAYSRFVGRQQELRKLTELMLPHPRSRYFTVTIDGIGGVGKSTLALELAYRYRDSYETLPLGERFEAIIWVSAKRTILTTGGLQQRTQTFSTLNDLYREIAAVLEQPAILHADIVQRRSLIEQALQRQRTMLIVDNLETVDDEELLTFIRELPEPTKVIVTTRHRIDMAYAIRLVGLLQTEGLALITTEATRKNVTLPEGADNDLYRRTGGIPLAIVWSISLMSMGHGVESILRRLGSGHSDIARFCFEESINRIRGHDAEQLLLALALFDGSVSRHMLGDITEMGSDEIGRDDGLAELIQLSLVNQEGDRFTLLPLTRSFALDQLTQRPELERKLREQWVTYLTLLARPYNEQYWLWPNPQGILREGSHLVTLANWCQQTARPDVLLRIIPALASYYDMRGQWIDMINIGTVGLEFARLTGDMRSIVSIETYILSWYLSHQGRYEEADHYISDALETAKQMDDIAWQSTVLGNYSHMLRLRKLFDQALACCQQALQLCTLLDDPQRAYASADIEYELGRIACDRADWLTARTHFANARNVFNYDDVNPFFNMELAWEVLSGLGFVAHQLGDLDTAAQMYVQALHFFRETGSKGFLTTLLNRLASLEEQRGNYNVAFNYAQEGLNWARRLGMLQEEKDLELFYTRLSPCS